MPKIIVTGLVATTPRFIVADDDLSIASFRLAEAAPAPDNYTNWYTVVAYNSLAKTVETAIKKGETLSVSGTLRVRDWASGERSGVTVEVVADSIL